MSRPRRFFQRLCQGAYALIGRLKGDQRGAIAVQFALLAIPLSILVFALVDLGRVSLQRRQMQDALDAATLFAARSTAVTDAGLEAVGDPAFMAEIAGMNLGLTASNATFKAGVDNHIIGTATATLKPIIANLWTKSDFTVTATSDVVRSSVDLEVAVVLDITGSMSGSRITDLKTGASDLVDIVVKDVQEPFYSKVAIVPYSVGVNVGSAYADAIRGPVTARTITNISKANPAVVTSAAHGFIVGDKVTISGVSGPTALNGNTYNVTAVSTNSFTINASTSSAPNYVSGGIATCNTSTNPGCENIAYTSANYTNETRAISTCVTERTGTEAYTDVAPSVASVGRNYPTTASNGTQANPCPTASITPLSSDRAALKAQINALGIGGSTAGQVGFAWGWYMISPNFGYLWPYASQRPAAYGGRDLMKVVVLMTDGAFNTPYCKGVIAKDAGSGSGATDDHINCNATNGDPFTQTRKLCDAMKNPAYRLTIFTVGFDVNDASAVSMLRYCATDADHVYFPATGSELKTVFKSIAQEISSLRIAK
ncbi:ubiquitin-activating E1 FCCH domain-containing protein [Caulobacter sp.]|uniref:ubiquitin-activating E1 FCCH domain-containing protein n=1 Tax=Caulobacter sp. TaxID=78 RepID=UPI002B49F359|nr:ubiquitin-activating E1 FCCH domain-containing protein [Caulobacter sp.]HJV43311.1 ubiquitin-activating E1 FCCH domain-containing protein [Caulobacter sp.]